MVLDILSSLEELQLIESGEGPLLLIHLVGIGLELTAEMLLPNLHHGSAIDAQAQLVEDLPQSFLPLLHVNKALVVGVQAYLLLSEV